MPAMLFFDDESLTRRDNVIRRLGTPRRIEASVYHDPMGNCTWGYPAVFRDERQGGYLMLYGVNFNPSAYAGGESLALARSDDGIHWQPHPRAAEIDLPGRSAPHQVAFTGPGIFSSGFLAEPAVPGLERYNVLRHTLPAGELWTSPDCLRWRRVEGARWQNPNPDPPTFVVWNPARHRYVLSTRPDFCDRRIALYETSDFQQFSPLELALHADSLDRSLTQIYGLPIFAYAGRYIGLPWMFDISATETAYLPHKYLGGKQHAQLAYSLDGMHWHRGPRQPFIANGEPGDPDGGCLQPSSMLQLDDGSLRFYASTSRHEHGHCPPDDGYIVAYSLRRDGFVYLESDGGAGVVGTRPLWWQGGDVELNVQAPAGWVRVQVTDPRGKPLPGYSFADSETLHADNAAWKPTWKDGKTLAALADTMIRLEIHLENARLYALRGDYIECRFSDLQRLEQQSIRPTPAVVPR